MGVRHYYNMDPPIRIQKNVLIDFEDVQWINEQTKQKKWSVSEVIRQAIKQARRAENNE